VANPEQQGDRPVSEPETERNVPVQDGADKVYKRPHPRGKNVILLTTLVLAVIVIALASRYLL
jgi:hypothetical protein